MNEQDRIDALRGSAVGLLRARINQVLNALGIGLSDSSARLVSWAVLALVGINALFTLNIAAGFILGRVFGSTGAGFLALSGIYILLGIIYILLRGRIESHVQARVARRVHLATDNLNTSLNQVSGLRAEHPYREAFISGEPNPYLSLTLRYNEAKRQAERATGDLREGVEYVRHNYGKIFGYMAQSKIPAFGYIAPLVGLVKGSASPKSKASEARPSKPRAIDLLERKVSGVKPYIPYIAAAYSYLSPVLSAFVIGKTQNWLIGKLLGNKKKRK